MPEQVDPCLVLSIANLFLYLLTGILLNDLRKNPSPTRLGLLEAMRRLLKPMPMRFELVFYKILVERFGRELLILVGGYQLKASNPYILWLSSTR